MAYIECLPTRLNPLAERTCFSQVLLPACITAEAAEGLSQEMLANEQYRAWRAGAEAAATSYEIADQARTIVIAPLYMKNPYRSPWFFFLTPIWPRTS